MQGKRALRSSDDDVADDVEPLQSWLWNIEGDSGEGKVIVSVLSMTPVETKSNLLALASVKYGEIVMKDLKIVQGRNGKFLSFPSKSYLDKNGIQNFQNFLWLEKELKNFIEANTLRLYDEFTAEQDSQNRS